MGNGEKIKFWEDKRIPTIKGMKIRSNKPQNCPIEKVIEIINHQDKSWNEDLLKNLIIEEELTEIKKKFISNREQEDKIVWQNDKRGEYTVKSGYYIEVTNEVNIQNNINTNKNHQEETHKTTPTFTQIIGRIENNNNRHNNQTTQIEGTNRGQDKREQ